MSAQQEVSMTRVTAKPFVAGSFAALLGCTMFSTGAFAGKPLESILEDDGSVTTLYQDEEDGHFWCIFISADGKTFTVFDPGESNPNGDATGPGSHSDKPDVVGLIKSGAATYRVKIAPADSPELMAHLKGALGGDGGLGAHYNPSDDDNGSGPGNAPTHSMEVKKTPDEIRQEIAVANEIADALATLGASMGDGDEGGTESPTGPNKNGKGGNSGDDDGNYTEGQNKSVGQTENDLLGAKPEYVNPPHWERTSTGGGGHASTGGGASHNSPGGGAHNATGTHG
jgi:hypothetical protein